MCADVLPFSPDCVSQVRWVTVGVYVVTVCRYLVPFRDMPATVVEVMNNSTLWRLSDRQVQV